MKPNYQALTVPPENTPIQPTTQQEQPQTREEGSPIPFGVISPSFRNPKIIEQSKALSTMIQTGINLYNSKGGLVPLELAGTGLSLFIAKTKGGKTSLLCSLASLLMMEQNKTIIYITIEEPASSIYSRMITATAGYTREGALDYSYMQIQKDIEKGSFPEEIYTIDRTIEQSQKLWIVEGSAVSKEGSTEKQDKYRYIETIINTIKPFAYHLEQQNKEKPIIIIDYAQRMKTTERTASKTEEINIVIDRIIEEFNSDFPILSVAQITRESVKQAEAKEGNWENISSQDIGESKELENGATGVYLFWKLKKDEDKVIIKTIDHRYCESGSKAIFDMLWKNSCLSPKKEGRKNPFQIVIETTKEETKEPTPPKQEKGKETVVVNGEEIPLIQSPTKKWGKK